MGYGRMVLSLSLIGLVGCQKATVNEDLGTFNSASVSCESASTADGLEIVGGSSAQSGSVVNYALSSSGNCVDGQNVNWKVAGASRTMMTSSGLSSLYRKAGSYVVTAQEKSSSSGEVVSFKTEVVSTEVALSGPQAGFTFNDISYSLVIPAGVTVAAVDWNFGDGSAAVVQGNSVTHVYFEPGVYQLKVKVTDSDGKVTELSKRVNIITSVDGMSCIQELAISGATETKVNVPTGMSVYLPPCLVDRVGAVRWNFGDGQSGANQSVNHTYTNEGNYAITATLYLGSSQEAWITLDHTIRVIKDLTPEPEPTPEPTPEPEIPGSCRVQGEKRESHGELFSESVACGISGSKTVTYRERIVEECLMVVERLQWKEVSRDKEITHEGSCEGQSCRLPDGSLLADGASKVLYTAINPAGSCDSVKEVRSCANGVLSGSSNAIHNVCHQGCGDFGSHGTVKNDVVTGEVSVPKQCQYGEQGIFDIYTQISDQACVDGSVVSSNTRQGTLKTAGSCPVYSFVGTENYTTCSAACGGTQSRIYECRDDKGAVVSNDRCGDSMIPQVLRACDGDPESVRRQDISSIIEEANSSKVCPKNQIGVIAKSREVVNTKTYACIDHKVQLESDISVPGAWVEESFCRDYVARRCSQDSLNNTEAKGRYDWMVKCQSQLPVIKEFLDNFSDVKIKVDGTTVSVGGAGRELYPTFMDYSFKPEKPWIAPKNKNAACVMPATAYVATVCVSSCATPEQQILVQERAAGKLKYAPFIDALTKKAAYVASLQSEQSMSSNKVAKTKVDQWVTELIDTEHDILVFKMKSGRELRLTPNHPVVTADGMMKKAGEFKSGEALVQLGGALDPIVSIQPIKHFGKVYNVFVQSDDVHKNILVTNGYLNGSAFFQNEGAKHMNRSLFRNTLTRGVFSK